MSRPADIRKQVKNRYQSAAWRVTHQVQASCCSSCGCGPITANLYSEDQTRTLPQTALQASLGCGNPVALAELKEGEVVLDLGSGGGIDVLLSAKRVGPTGYAYGLDMTEQMLALAERNKAASGLTNVEFIKGHIEDIPLPDGTVDVILSNCVINLSVDKPRVIQEAYRVLKKRGRLAVSDIVAERNVPAAIKADMEAYAGCIAGALIKDEYIACLQDVGFKNISITPTRVSSLGDVETAIPCQTLASLDVQEKNSLDGAFYSAFIRAEKP